MKTPIDILSPLRAGGVHARSIVARLALSGLATLGSGALVLGAAVAGCGGGEITPELHDARSAVARARDGAAARLKPDDLRVAEGTLAEAEAAPDGSPREADLAYVAERQAEGAMAEARQIELERQAERAQARYRARLETIAHSQGERIEVTEQRLAEERRALADRERMLVEQEQRIAEQGAVVAESQAAAEQSQAAAEQSQAAAAESQAAAEQSREALATEREARLAAEQRAAAAMVRLRELAAVRQERDEIVITLSGEVLFESDRATLLGTARERLLAVADALRSTPEQSAVIEGHTDSRGSDEYNQRLSQQRADAVREFLVVEGAPAARLQAVGVGEARPIASNDDPEGRAVNRRVEVHLRPAVPAR